MCKNSENAGSLEVFNIEVYKKPKPGFHDSPFLGVSRRLRRREPPRKGLVLHRTQTCRSIRAI